MSENCETCGQLLPRDSLGGRVTALRVRWGMTMGNLSTHCLVSKSTISRIEDDKDCSTETLKRLAGFFEVSLDYLVYGKESKNDPTN